MNSILKSLALLVLRMLILSLALAYLLAFIEGLRTTGIQPYYFPFTTLSTPQPRLMNAAVLSNPFISFVDNCLYVYNCAFPGASRLGNGIGIVSAAFWSLHHVSRSNRVERIVMGAVAGAIIGFRMMFMVSSNATSVIVACILGMIGFAIYMALSDRKPPIPSIPIVAFNR